MLVAASLCLLGCDDGSDMAQQGSACPVGFETCNGAEDCVSTCVCAGDSLAACMDRCGGKGGPYVSALDENEWSEDWSDFEADVLKLVNAERAKGGCCGDSGCFPPSTALELDPRLRKSARAHARDMGEEDYFDHISLDGRTPFDRMREAGFKQCAMGENIAAGQPTPAAVMNAWMKSEGHCKNILEPNFDRIGIGYYESGNQTEWVQNFGG